MVGFDNMKTLYNPFRSSIKFKHSTFTREQIRGMARFCGIKRGRNTQDTLTNLKAAGCDLGK